MNQAICIHGFTAAISPQPNSPSATHAEREARCLLSLNTPADTARAKQVLRGAGNGQMSAEWHFLMGVCDLRQGYIADAQARLDHACILCEADGDETEREYRTMYESVRDVVRRKERRDGENGKKSFFDIGFCDCSYCIECSDSGCCDGFCDGGCGDGGGCCDGNCCDGCN